MPKTTLKDRLARGIKHSSKSGQNPYLCEVRKTNWLDFKLTFVKWAMVQREK